MAVNIIRIKIRMTKGPRNNQRIAEAYEGSATRKNGRPNDSTATQLSTDGRERMRAGLPRSFRSLPRSVRGGSIFETSSARTAGPKPAATRRRPALLPCRSPSRKLRTVAKGGHVTKPEAVTPVRFGCGGRFPRQKRVRPARSGQLSVHAAFSSIAQTFPSARGRPGDEKPCKTCRGLAAASSRRKSSCASLPREYRVAPSIQRHGEPDGVAVVGDLYVILHVNRLTFSSATATICCAGCR